MKNKKRSLCFDDYPNLKLGFSTQNFLKCMPVNLENLEEIITFAAVEGYSFIELRDPEAVLSLDECKKLAEIARSNEIEVLYEINTNILAPGFLSVFKKGLENTTVFTGKGILRTLISNTEFAADPKKKGWTKEELDQIVEIANNKSIGLQFDTSNPFQNISREKSNPDQVEKYLTTITDRWFTTHLKSGKDGVFLPVLNDNPLDLGKVLSLMNTYNVPYVAFELASVSDKHECFENHARSINYLYEKGLIKICV